MQKGSVYKRSNGLYQGTIMYNGVKKVFYSRSRSDVCEKMNDWYYEMKYSNVNNDNIVNFSDYVYRFLYTYKYGFIKPQSFDRLESIYKCHILKSDIDVPMYKLNDLIIQKYLNDKVSLNLSQSSLKKIYELIVSVLSYAYRRNDISVDYASLLVCPRSKIETKKIDTYTSDDINLLESTIRDSLVSKDYNTYRLFRYSPVFLLMLHTGVRCGEILALTWSCVDFDNRLIYINKSLHHCLNRDSGGTKYIDIIGDVKTDNSRRVVPVNAVALECLQYLRSISTSDYVVDNGNGNFLKLRSFEQTFKRICEYCGVKHKGLHALRHTFASILIDSNVSAKTVSMLLGHSSVVFTLNKYVHVDNDALRSGVDSITY